jgi:hypothetical protein
MRKNERKDMTMAKRIGNLPLTLTKLEDEILQHRLDVPDALSEYLIDSGWPEPDVEEVVSAVCAREWAKACEINEPLAKATLKDAVEGSTYYGCGMEELSDQKLAGIARAGWSLARKVGELIGESVKFPEY